MENHSESFDLPELKKHSGSFLVEQDGIAACCQSPLATKMLLNSDSPMAYVDFLTGALGVKGSRPDQTRTAQRIPSSPRRFCSKGPTLEDGRWFPESWDGLVDKLPTPGQRSKEDRKVLGLVRRGRRETLAGALTMLRGVCVVDASGQCARQGQCLLILPFGPGRDVSGLAEGSSRFVNATLMTTCFDMSRCRQ